MYKHKIKVEIVELEAGTFHPLIKTEAEGLDNYWWVIDSGASKSVVDKNLPSLYAHNGENGTSATGLGKENVETFRGEIKDVILGNIYFGSLEVAIVDLFHINEEYSKFSEKKIAGLLGSDFLKRHYAILDYGKAFLYLHKG